MTAICMLYLVYLEYGECALNTTDIVGKCVEESDVDINLSLSDIICRWENTPFGIKFQLVFTI